MNSAEPLLDVRNLTIRYRTGARQITAVRDVSFALNPGGSLAIVGVLSSAVSCYYYLRVIVAMYFIEPSPDEAEIDKISLPMSGALTFCAVAVVLFGLFPAALFDYLSALMRSFT